jgi:hypothetical protein
MRMSTRRRSLIGDMADGAIAGLAATWVMGKVTSALYARENSAARQREDSARGGKTSFGVAAEKLAHAVGRDLSDDERKKYGSAIHWSLGIAMGAVYGAMRGRVPHADVAHGLLFGTLFFLTVDEIGTTALDLTPGPSHFPWQTHARGLAGHLTYGAVADRLSRIG